MEKFGVVRGEEVEKHEQPLTTKDILQIAKKIRRIENVEDTGIAKKPRPTIYPKK